MLAPLNRTPPANTPAPEAHAAHAAHAAYGDVRAIHLAASRGISGAMPPAPSATAALWGFPMTSAPGMSAAGPYGANPQQQPQHSTSPPPGHSPPQAPGAGSGSAHLSARPRSLNPLRASPVHAAIATAEPEGMGPLQQPWSIALANADAKLSMPMSHGGGRGSNMHRRTPSNEARCRGNCSKVSSVASSMVSLDSTAVD